jgi:hypothetical protein
MYFRFIRLLNALIEVAKKNADIKALSPTVEQLALINELLTKCICADKVTKFLQREDITLVDVRNVLDAYIKDYPDSAEYIGPNSKVL